MMPLTDATPFRQIVRAYSALLSINQNVARLTNGTLETQKWVKPLQCAAPNEAATAPVQAGQVMQPEAPVDLYERLGFTFLLERSSIVDRMVIDTGTWEPKQLEYFAGLVERFRGKPNAVFFDIGSYWGLYSFLTLQAGVFDEIYAFDADRHNFAQLQANLFLNNAAHAITAINKAVSDKPGQLSFWDSRTQPDKNRAGVGVIDEAAGLSSYTVEAVSVDSFVTSTGGNFLMKIDVEGHEESVLKGMHNTLAGNKVVMQIEVFEQDHERVFAEVSRLGLRQIHSIYPDYYLTNMTVEELGI